LKHGGFVTYGDNNQGRILVSGDIGEKDSLIIKDVLLVEGLKQISTSFVTKALK